MAFIDTRLPDVNRVGAARAVRSSRDAARFEPEFMGVPRRRWKTGVGTVSDLAPWHSGRAGESCWEQTKLRVTRNLGHRLREVNMRRSQFGELFRRGNAEDDDASGKLNNFPGRHAGSLGNE